MSKFRSVTRSALTAVLIGTAALGSAGPATAAPGTLHGDPQAAAQYWEQQTTDDCVLMAVADVVGQVTGELPSEDDIIATASSTPSESHTGPIYTAPGNPADPRSGAGTDGGDVPALLRVYGIDSDYTDDDRGGQNGNIDSGMAALTQYLSQGRKVIAIVDVWPIWNQEADDDGSNHGLVVTGVDTGADIVYLNDSGVETGAGEQTSIETFQKAWAASDGTMIVTRPER